MLRLIPLIPLLPFLGFLFCGLAGHRVSRRAVSWIACGSVFAALLISAGAVLQLPAGRMEARAAPDRAGVHIDPEQRRVQVDVYDWLPLGPPPRPSPVGETGGAHSSASFDVSLSLALDPLSAVMVLVVTGVGFLIHVYSVGYMGGDPGFARYFSYLNLFTAMMLVLVLGANFLIMFVGWEGVGLCSYLLIGFWYEDVEKASAGRKAFIVNRIGDLGFILGILGVLGIFGTLDIHEVMSDISAGAAGLPGDLALTLIALALFTGACGKSAQLPLYVWLPDAMAGPTPVSALIHAATMVTAGVYMVSRCSALYLHAPAALGLVAVVGAATALLGATIGLAQNDIKKVLAYSTVSQLGLMFLGVGVGAFAASIFHLVTHAFFKALLFLGSGSVMHAMGGETDIRRMGGLRSRLPVTYWTFVTGALAISGIPPLAGFFSKDEILAAAWGAGRPLLWAAGTAVSLCTAFYMFRLVMMVFHGDFRGSREQEHHLHESPRFMTVPLIALAVLSIVGGWIGIPVSLGFLLGIPDVIERWLEPVLETVPASAGGVPAAGLLILAATAVAAIGIGSAVAFYRAGSDAPQRVARGAGPLYGLVANRYWVDELYDATVLRAYYGGCAAFEAIDRTVIDGIVNGLGVLAQGAGQIVRLVQTGFVRNYALLLLIGAVALLWYLISS